MDSTRTQTLSIDYSSNKYKFINSLIKIIITHTPTAAYFTIDFFSSNCKTKPKLSVFPHPSDLCVGGGGSRFKMLICQINMSKHVNRAVST